MARMTQEARQDLRNWRQEHGRFVARATGTRFLRPLCQYDIRMAAPRQKVAQSLGDRGIMPFPVAADEAHAHMHSIAGRPDIDPDDDLRGAMLQQLARCADFPHAGCDPFVGLAIVIASTGRRRRVLGAASAKNR